jgi:hypothetical protein
MSSEFLILGITPNLGSQPLYTPLRRPRMETRSCVRSYKTKDGRAGERIGSAKMVE